MKYRLKFKANDEKSYLGFVMKVIDLIKANPELEYDKFQSFYYKGQPWWRIYAANATHDKTWRDASLYLIEPHRMKMHKEILRGPGSVNDKWVPIEKDILELAYQYGFTIDEYISNETQQEVEDWF